MSSTDESLLAGGGESSPADRIHAEDGAAKTIDEKKNADRFGFERGSMNIDGVEIMEGVMKLDGKREEE